MKNKKPLGAIISAILSTILSIILINLGVIILSEKVYIGVITILIGITLLYFAYYVFQIKINETKIKELEEWKETKEELLNTLKDIVILKKVSRIK